MQVRGSMVPDWGIDRVGPTSRVMKKDFDLWGFGIRTFRGAEEVAGVRVAVHRACRGVSYERGTPAGVFLMSEVPLQGCFS